MAYDNQQFPKWVINSDDGKTYYQLMVHWQAPLPIIQLERPLTPSQSFTAVSTTGNFTKINNRGQLILTTYANKGWMAVNQKVYKKLSAVTMLLTKFFFLKTGASKCIIKKLIADKKLQHVSIRSREHPKG